MKLKLLPLIPPGFQPDTPCILGMWNIFFSQAVNLWFSALSIFFEHFENFLTSLDELLPFVWCPTCLREMDFLNTMFLFLMARCCQVSYGRCTVLAWTRSTKPVAVRKLTVFWEMSNVTWPGKTTLRKYQYVCLLYVQAFVDART